MRTLSRIIRFIKSKACGSKDVLNDISFQVSNGEFVGLVGPSGSGKTTILQHFTGLLKPTAGKIYVDNEDINQKKYSI